MACDSFDKSVASYQPTCCKMIVKTCYPQACCKLFQQVVRPSEANGYWGGGAGNSGNLGGSGGM